jgi:hypothetical protein
MRNDFGSVLREQLNELGLAIAPCTSCGAGWESALNAWGTELASKHRGTLLDIIKQEATNFKLDYDEATANELIDHCFIIARGSLISSAKIDTIYPYDQMR